MKPVLMQSAAVVTLFAACSILANATPIAAGGSVVASPLNPVVTKVLAGYGDMPFTSQAPAGMASTFNGTYSAAVFTDATNFLCASAGNCLTFGIQVKNSSTSADGIETVTTGPFSNLFTYNVGYVPIVGAYIAPLQINDSANGTISFKFTLGSNWANMIMPGFSSDYLVIQSSATAYSNASISFQDNQTATVAGFLPSVAITPEPSSLLLLGTGFCGVAGTMLRKQRNAQ